MRKHLEALVSDLLTLAKLEAEVPAQIREEFDLKAIIDDQIASRAKALREREIQVTLECPQIQIQADRSRLGTALSNLIDNAIHYNRTARRDSHCRRRRRMERCVFRLPIPGTAFPPEELPRIFERFYRVDKARSRESGGTGLGLSIVKHAIESQGGSITVASKLGAGSTFTIHLPA